jgi:hypothetical protein
MTAWIMVDSRGVPTTRNMYALYDGFKELGEEIKTYTAAAIFDESIPYTRDNIVVGHIDQCRRHVKKITGLDVPNIDYPLELCPYYGRKIWKKTLGDVYDSIVENDGFIEPLFIKSIQQKYFTGFVCRSFEDYSKNCSGLDYKTEIFASEVVKFVSEYRTYIHRHNIISCLRYKGDYSKAPNKQTVEAMLKSLDNAHMPIAYSIDVGIIENGETILVECNDGFALGNYGLGSRDYAEMHRDRWYQMVNSKE